MAAQVKQQEGGDWAVVDRGEVLAANMTNSQAWRLADKLNGEAVNRQQVVSNWVFKQQANGQ